MTFTPTRWHQSWWNSSPPDQAADGARCVPAETAKADYS
jgi:hypothetical protein